MPETVDAYLDRLFDQLAGTGGAGRRALMEAQAHLEEDVEHAIAQGQSGGEAERDAIARFGAPDEIARAHVEARPLPIWTVLRRIAAAGWLMAGVGGAALCVMGVANLLFATFVTPTFVTEDAPDSLYSLERCRALGVFDGDQTACRAASIADHVQNVTYRPLAAGIVGIVLLILFAIARRRPALRAFTELPNPAMLSSAGAVAFGATGLVLLLYGALGFAFGQRSEVGLHLAEGLAAITASAAFVPRAWREMSARRA